MDKMKTPVITINREYGAGGRTLASILSEKLNIPYFDREFVNKTMDKGGFDKDDVEREGEELSRSSEILENLFNSTVSFSSSHDVIFEAEKKVILELAESPCIMVGRCANRILEEAGIENISIYLHASHEYKLKRTEELKEYGEMKPEKFMEKRDEQRRSFYKKYTGYEISDASNYTLCFDTGRISIPLCADIVINMLQQREM